MPNGYISYDEDSQRRSRVCLMWCIVGECQHHPECICDRTDTLRYAVHCLKALLCFGNLSPALMYFVSSRCTKDQIQKIHNVVISASEDSRSSAYAITGRTRRLWLWGMGDLIPWHWNCRFGEIRHGQSILHMLTFPLWPFDTWADVQL